MGIHRDLKPENLLLLRKPNNIDNNSSNIAKTFLGARGYLAPEMLQRKHYASAVDTWALGVILYVLLCGCLPFDDDSQVLKNNNDSDTTIFIQARFILRYPRWANHLSSNAKDLLSHLLDIDPNTRYTAHGELNHPWITSNTTNDDDSDSKEVAEGENLEEGRKGSFRGRRD